MGEKKMTEKDMKPSEIRRASISFWKIKKIAGKHHEERYDTDWDSMQEALMKIWELTK